MAGTKRDALMALLLVLLVLFAVWICMIPLVGYSPLFRNALGFDTVDADGGAGMEAIF